MTPLDASAEAASALQLTGAFLFGMVIGWFLYFVNRHRTEEVKLADVASLIAAIGAGAILALFPAGSDLFGAYGIGLAVGFFLYLVVLVVIVAAQKSWTFEWMLDGRVPNLREGQRYPGETQAQRPLHDRSGPR